MLRLLADENFQGQILRQLRRHSAAIDIVRVQDVGLMGASDRAILEWAAAEGRVVLTHDVNTMTYEAYERVRLGLTMPGVVVVPADLDIGVAVEHLLVVAECGLPEDCENQVRYLPM